MTVFVRPKLERKTAKPAFSKSPLWGLLMKTSVSGGGKRRLHMDRRLIETDKKLPFSKTSKNNVWMGRKKGLSHLYRGYQSLDGLDIL